MPSQDIFFGAKIMKSHNGEKVGLNIWLKSGDETVFCQGRALLLERIREHGSLRQAAKSLKMSYRAAWGKLKQTHDVLGRDLIILTSSRPQRYELTELGQNILNAYHSWREKVESCAASEASELSRLFESKDYHG
jgi:molybdate transport system regulatory protein